MDRTGGEVSMDEIPNLSESLRDIASYHSRVADMCYGEISVTEDHFASVAHRAAELLERYQWIPVSERLPDEGVVVLVYSPPTKDDWPDDIRMDFDCIDPDAPDSWLRHNENYEHYCAVSLPEGSAGPSEKAPYTHWMPLPEPPEQ